MFSLGVVLYELLTGQRPFTAATVPALLQRIMTETPARPSSLRPELPRELDRVILTAISKAPGARFGTWAEIALELVKVGRLSVYQQTISDSERFESLRRVEMLKKLDDGQIWELVHAGNWRRLPAHSQIIRENEPGDSLFFLAKGQAKATKQGRPLNLIGAGECLGEMSYIREGMARQATVETLTEAVVAEFGGAEIERISVNCQLHFTRAIVRTLVERLELANTRVAPAIKQ
jgi:hypothetical protein